MNLSTASATATLGGRSKKKLRRTKASPTVDAPVWRAYLRQRVPHDAKDIVAERSHHRKRKTLYYSTESSLRDHVSAYWMHLDVTERQQILFIDDPDLVKQLYKLNLSLLCVGLMQRHLKTPATSALKATHGEKTYELLEAMEFMDIGTGILTVKSELMEDPARLFTLLNDVLHGFLSSLHVLGEHEFSALFVNESDVINTWDDYQRLIAMLVEQLMLKSFIAFQEKQATSQMEKLLMEVSLEDAAISKKKKKKKRKKKTTPAPVHDEEETDEDEHDEPEREDDAMDQSAGEKEVLHGEAPSRRISPRLNPHAQAFEPPLAVQLTVGTVVNEARHDRKRKFDELVLHLEPQDVEYDELKQPDDEFTTDNQEHEELQWQLQHIYSSTATILGWDCVHQCDVLSPYTDWNDQTLWRTGPRDVVRYFSPMYQSDLYPPPAAPPVPSRYYFVPPPPFPIPVPQSHPDTSILLSFAPIPPFVAPSSRPVDEATTFFPAPSPLPTTTSAAFNTLPPSLPVPLPSAFHEPVVVPAPDFPLHASSFDVDAVDAAPRHRRSVHHPRPFIGG